MLKSSLFWRGLLSFCIGSIFGFLTTRWSFFNFEKDINVIELCNLIVTILLGLYIAISIPKRQTETRVEKDLLFTELNSVKKEYFQIYQSVQNANIPFRKTLEVFKTISGHFQTLDQITDACNIKCASHLQSLQNQHMGMWNTITDSSTSENKLILSPSDKILFLKQYKTFTQELYALIITINRY